MRELTLGRFEIIRLAGKTIGRATYQRGWTWSEHVGGAFADGRVIERRTGQLFFIPAEPHDSWVVGDVPYVSRHFMGAERYAK